MSTKHVLATACAVLAATAATFAIDPPDSQVNLVNNNIETAMQVWSGDDFDVSLVIQHPDGTRQVEPVTTDPQNDFAPRIASAPNGDTWVVWWNEAATDEIRVRKRNYADAAWSTVRTVSADGESGTQPAIVHDGVDPWVAYTSQQGSEQSIVGIIITDEPDPIGMRTVVASTRSPSRLDLDIQASEGNVWITWVDGASTVGWSEYDRASATWSAPSFESYASDSVASARARIRAVVTDP